MNEVRNSTTRCVHRLPSIAIAVALTILVGGAPLTFLLEEER